jgi:di/tricarboxylate transporter
LFLYNVIRIDEGIQLTPEIAIVLTILSAAVILFVTERIRIDLVALMVMVTLALTNLVSPAEALSGFSNSAVVTVWAVLILSAGLTRTGVANFVGRQVMRLAGHSEERLIAVIMLSAGILSGFMNNIGVAAMLMPVVIDIARRTGRPPSRLLMPLAFSTLMGGMITQIGTPPNILISEAMRDMNLDAFRMFDYAPTGLVVTIAGVAFMVLLGRHGLPVRDISKEAASLDTDELEEVYDIRERLFQVRLPIESLLDGKTLAESRLGSALGLNVIAILRDRRTRLAPDPGTPLESGDTLLVGGRPDQLGELQGRRHIILEENQTAVEKLISEEVAIVEAALSPNSSLVARTIVDGDIRRRYQVNIIGICRDGKPLLEHIQDVPLQRDDSLLVQGFKSDLDHLAESSDIASLTPLSNFEILLSYHLNERLLSLRVPEDSILVGKTLLEGRLRDAFGLEVLAIIRNGNTYPMPSPEELLHADDVLVVEGHPQDLAILRGLQELEMDPRAELDLSDYESDRIGVAEVVLSPHSTLTGRNLRELHFREKYGLSVLAIWRGGKPYRSGIRDMPLRFGDALLLYGPRNKINVLGREPDFLVLTEEAQEAPRLAKAPLAVVIMGLVLSSVILDMLPISIAAVLGLILMILTGCLTMEEAYRSIEWKAIFLIAGMLPLGIAMERTGAASFLADGIVGLVGGLGSLGVVAGLFIMAAISAQFMPNPAVAVILAPIALSTATDLGISPYPLLMTVAVSASAAFLSPVGHPANVLIMGPGGYRYKDYVKVGLPLTLLILVIVLFVLPVFWPF